MTHPAPADGRVSLALGVAVAAWLGLLAVAAAQADAQRWLMLAALLPVAAGIVAAGPMVALPLYFATWFGAGVELPGLPVSVNRVAALLLVLSLGVQFLRRPARLVPSSTMVLLAALTLYAVVGGLLMKAPGAEPSIQQVIYLGVALLVAMWLSSARQVLALAAILLGITTVLSSLGLVEFVLQRDLFAALSDHRNVAPDLRINGLSRNAIQFAFNAAWVMPWAMVLAVESRRWWTRALAVGALLFLIAVSLLTYNRQTPIIVALMLGAGVVLLRSPWRVWLIGGMALVGVAVAPVVIDKVAARFVEVGSSGRPDVSYAIRRDKARVAMHIIRERPWFGIGLNNFKDVWWDWREVGTLYVIHTQKEHKHYVDLGYLQIVTETGLVGAALFVVLMMAALWRWMAALRSAAGDDDTARYHVVLAVGMGFVQLALSMLLQDTFFTPHTYLLFGLLMAATGLASPAEHLRNETTPATSSGRRTP